MGETGVEDEPCLEMLMLYGDVIVADEFDCSCCVSGSCVEGDL